MHWLSSSAVVEARAQGATVDDGEPRSARVRRLKRKSTIEDCYQPQAPLEKRKRGRPKTPTKEGSGKKPKTESKGTRRSQRLVVEEDQDESVELEDKEEISLEDDTNQEPPDWSVEEPEQVEQAKAMEMEAKEAVETVKEEADNDLKKEFPFAEPTVLKGRNF